MILNSYHQATLCILSRPWIQNMVKSSPWTGWKVNEQEHLVVLSLSLSLKKNLSSWLWSMVWRSCKQPSTQYTHTQKQHETNWKIKRQSYYYQWYFNARISTKMIEYFVLIIIIINLIVHWRRGNLSPEYFHWKY